MQIRRQMGIHDDAQTYIQLMVQKLTGWLPPADLTMKITGIVFAISVVGSVTWNVLDARAKKKGAASKA
jgi:hypothetical protein